MKSGTEIFAGELQIQLTAFPRNESEILPLLRANIFSPHTVSFTYQVGKDHAFQDAGDCPTRVCDLQLNFP